MKILITNDDGIYAPGIHALANLLSKEHDVYMYAPHDEKSGVGHSFTFLHPLRIFEHNHQNYRAFAITGTPVDCVRLGAYHMTEEWGIRPDCIVSGINRGANIGTDVLYSGTASAAMEACLLAYPALAVSCVGREEPLHYESAAQYAKQVIDLGLIFDLPPLIMLNLNVPDAAYEKIAGMQICKLGTCNYSNNYRKCIDPRGNDYYWLDDQMNPTEDHESDIEWISKGFATLTPIESDRTAYTYLDKLKAIANQKNME